MDQFNLTLGVSKDRYNVWAGSVKIGEVKKDTSFRNKESYNAYVVHSKPNRELEYLTSGLKTIYAAKAKIIKWYKEKIEEDPNYFSFEYQEKAKTDVRGLPCGEDSEFYPTPDSLIGKMLGGIEWDKVMTILEPQAGKGDIVKGVIKANQKGSRYHETLDIDCIEKDTYLQHILRGEGYRVIHDDFLTFNGRKHYDLIIMNPPFSNADAHLLKALDIQNNNGGGGIICLMNAETLRNPCTKQRQYLLQRLTEANAQIKYFKHEFKKAERQTDVEVALVKILIPYNAGRSKIYDGLSKKYRLYEEEIPDKRELAPSELIKCIVQQYNVEVDASLELIREYKAMCPYIFESFDSKSVYKDAILTLNVSNGSGTLNVNRYLKRVRAKYWEVLFSKKEFVGKLTSNLQRKYRSMVDELSDYDFTEYNIERIHRDMNAEMTQGIKQSILDLFDKLTAEHTWYPECKKNIHYYNGWKTNLAHKIGYKVILPVNGMFSNCSWTGHFNESTVYEALGDIEKVFNYLEGNMNAESWLDQTIALANKRNQTKNIKCKFFTVTIYKKGTAHIKFREEYYRLIEMMNIFAARNKSWLPPSYGYKQYEEMDEEEKNVIDEFQGAEEYGKVMANKGGYLFKVPEMALLSA